MKKIILLLLSYNTFYPLGMSLTTNTQAPMIMPMQNIQQQQIPYQQNGMYQEHFIDVLEGNPFNKGLPPAIYH